MALLKGKYITVAAFLKNICADRGSWSLFPVGKEKYGKN
nr:MAG TPA: hypothetical protein [Caudoviricetes sp.]